MLTGKILFNATAAPIDAGTIKTFTIVQNNRNVVIHEVEFMRSGTVRRMFFLNLVEASRNGDRYVQAQSNRKFCARLELDEAAEEGSLQ